VNNSRAGKKRRAEKEFMPGFNLSSWASLQSGHGD
jgi:hypothetical protein